MRNATNDIVFASIFTAGVVFAFIVFINWTFNVGHNEKFEACMSREYELGTRYGPAQIICRAEIKNGTE